MPLFDVNHNRIFEGQAVKIVARSRTHEGKNENLIGRIGIVSSLHDSKERINVQLISLREPKQLGSAGTYFPEELSIIDAAYKINSKELQARLSEITPLLQSKQTKAKTEKIPIVNTQQSEVIKLTYEEYRVFENFFQYGDLKNAKLVFVGLEEGLGGQKSATVVDSRFRWSRGEGRGVSQFKDHLLLNEAFYINDIVEAAWDVTKETFNNNRKKFEMDLSIRGVMMYQARMICLLKSNFEFLNMSAAQKKKELHNCFHHILHKPRSGTAMFERYPLPMQSVFLYQVEGLPFYDYDSYIDYNNLLDNHRVKQIKAIYDIFELPVSIVYAGIRKNDFKLLPFYRDVLGFNFDEMYTSQSNPNSPYVSTIKEDKARKFLIGSRKKNDGSIQKAIITPFLGVGNLSYADVDAITSWIDIKL